MAACTNNGGSRARRAVTAALVGVLSVGAVPMAALAEGVADAVTPLFAEDVEFTNGTADLTFKTRGEEGLVAVSADKIGEDVNGVTTVDADQLPIYVSIDSVTIAGTEFDALDEDGNVSDYKVRVYKADENGDPTGTPLSGNKVIDAGEYVATVTALTGSDYAGQTVRASFIVKGIELGQVTPYENGDADDVDFGFTGSALDVDFKTADGTELVEGVDYTVSYRRGGQAVSDVVDAGDYTATLTGIGKYAGSSATKTFNVHGFNLSNPNVTVQVDPFTGAAPEHPARVYYTASDGDVTDLDPSLVYLEGTVGEALETAYSLTVKADPDALESGNIRYETVLTVGAYKVDALCDFQYNGSALADSYELDASKNEVFNLDAITASYGSNKVDVTVEKGDVTLDKKADVEYKDSAWNSLMNGIPGEYTVTVEVPVDADAKGNVYGGSKTFTVKVYKGVIDADQSLYVYYNDNPVAITSLSKLYDGEEISTGNFDVVGKSVDEKDIKKTLVDESGNAINSAVNAGSYGLVVTSEWYKLSGTTELPITISKVDLTSLEIGELEKWNNIAGQEYLPLAYEFVDTDSDGDGDTWELQDYPVNFVDSAIHNLDLNTDKGDGTMVDLPGNVDVVVEFNDDGTWKEVGTIEDEGDYRLTVSVAEDVASNYVLPEGETSVTIEFTVAFRGTFSDVQPSDWCYEAVENASFLGYMSGYGTTGVFGPDDVLTRGQAVSVLYKMSGDYASDTNAQYNENLGWVTGFDDVDGKMYYAEAIAWAEATGVVNGYDEDTFGPEDPVTREQFAGMLMNYAEIVNRDETVGTADVDAVLAEFPDGAQVSDWAAEAVAWAAEKEVMGNNGSLMPSNSISRAEVAAMAVNYQPINKGGLEALY